MLSAAAKRPATIDETDAEQLLLDLAQREPFLVRDHLYRWLRRRGISIHKLNRLMFEAGVGARSPKNATYLLGRAHPRKQADRGRVVSFRQGQLPVIAQIIDRTCGELLVELGQLKPELLPQSFRPLPVLVPLLDSLDQDPAQEQKFCRWLDTVLLQAWGARRKLARHMKKHEVSLYLFLRYHPSRRFGIPLAYLEAIATWKGWTPEKLLAEYQAWYKANP